jgi:1,4-alpha-glucan branching enzyme
MLFMGEEFACDQPFQFFVDFSDSSLRRSVVKGRRREYPQHDWSEGSSPVKPAAFHHSKIGNRSDGDAEMVSWYRNLISLRKQWIESGLLCNENLQIDSNPNQGVFVMRYRDNRQNAAVVIRLNPVHWNAASIQLPVTGQPILDSNKNVGNQKLQANHAMVIIA